MSQFFKILVLSLGLVVTSVSWANSGIIGNLDSSSLANNQFIQNGWACDLGVRKSIPVHIYLARPDGSQRQFFKGVIANINNESAVNQRCGTSNINHRFRIQFSPDEVRAHQGKIIYAHGISQTNKANLAVANSGLKTVPKFTVQTVTKNLIKDDAFRFGFNVKHPDGTNGPELKIPLSNSTPADLNADPIWGIAQWGSLRTLNPSPVVSGNNVTWSSPGYKRVVLNTADRSLEMAINSVSEYNGVLELLQKQENGHTFLLNSAFPMPMTLIISPQTSLI
jgi:hypothetical protein